MNPDDYVEAFKTFVTYEDKMWGLPMGGETTGLFYRTDLFEEAGIDDPPTTWEEFEATAAALTDEPARTSTATSCSPPRRPTTGTPGSTRPAATC